MEDVLTEQAAKIGFYDRPVVQNESLFAFDLLHDKLKSSSKSVSAALTSFSAELIKTKLSSSSAPASSSQSNRNTSFRPPPRKLVKDDVRDAWIEDLAGGKNLGDLAKAGIPL